MFEHNFANRSKAGKISVHDVFDDIKLTAGGDELSEQGYITLDYENRELKLKYMVKPCDSPRPIGRGFLNRLPQPNS